MQFGIKVESQFWFACPIQHVAHERTSLVEFYKLWTYNRATSNKLHASHRLHPLQFADQTEHAWWPGVEQTPHDILPVQRHGGLFGKKSRANWWMCSAPLYIHNRVPFSRRRRKDREKNEHSGEICHFLNPRSHSSWKDSTATWVDKEELYHQHSWHGST